MKRKITLAAIIALFIIGFLIMAYPYISDFWNQMRTDVLVSTYTDNTEKMPEADIGSEIKQAEEYNRHHTSNTLADAFGESSPFGKEYRRLLDPSGNGMMGYIEIPKIEQRLAIFHGTDKETLAEGCGHVAGTSLPVGGPGTHAVIAAHRGLSSARMFTDLDKLETGDRFYLFILNKKLVYEVDQIKVVTPDSFDELQIVEGEDHVTLLTCTPYAVNTHRLLVRGRRTDDSQEDHDVQITIWKSPGGRMLKILLLLFVSASVIAAGRKISVKAKSRRSHRHDR